MLICMTHDAPFSFDDDLDEQDTEEGGLRAPTDEEVRAALSSLHSEEIEFDSVLLVAFADDLYEQALLPKIVIDTITLKYEVESDLVNGGLDQMVWNVGFPLGHLMAEDLNEVGASRNGQLVGRLADELQRFETGVPPEAIASDPVTHFLRYRRSVNGPFFDVPDLRLEVEEAICSYLLTHRDGVPRPDAPLTRREELSDPLIDPW